MLLAVATTVDEVFSAIDAIEADTAHQLAANGEGASDLRLRFAVHSGDAVVARAVIWVTPTIDASQAT